MVAGDKWFITQSRVIKIHKSAGKMKEFLGFVVLLQLATALDLNPMCRVACPMVYSPVCGSDGKTYSNACVMSSINCNSKQAVSVAHSGECFTEAAASKKRAFISCYECNSGVAVDNPNCPANGTTHDGHTTHRECASKCFVRDNEYYSNVVFRGCIADYPDILNPIPEDGFHGYHHGEIFICSTNLCNGKPFTPPATPPDNIGLP